MGRRKQEIERAQARRRRVIRQIFIACAVAVIVLIAAVGFAVRASGHRTPRQTALSSSPIDGITCGAEQVAYHEHAHLSILVRGKSIPLPNTIGHRDASQCLYWLHTHDSSGILHIEAPHRIVPTLGTFFDVWGQPLSQTRVWKFETGSGQSMKVYVDGKPFLGNPRIIKLKQYTTMTIEIGPPFVTPRHYKFPPGY